MSKFAMFFKAIIGGTIITLISLAVSFLITVFQSDEDGKRYSFFKSLFFESTTKLDGTTTLTFGFTDNVMPILLFFTAIFAVLLVFQILYTKINERRNQLINNEQK